MSSHTTSAAVAVVGHTGLIGSHVARLLEARGYDVLGVTHETSPALDLTAPESMERLFDGRAITHVVVAAGEARFGRFDELDAEAFEVGLRHKLMGQVSLAMTALRRLPEGGSVTVTSGALAHDPIPGSAPVALVNGALDSFVRAVALDAPAGRRVNAVSPGWIRETRERMGLDPAGAYSAADVARLYLHAIESDAHGQVIEDAPEAPITVRGVDHVVLRVRDLPRMIRFYEEVLGCRLERGPGDAQIAQLRAGRALIDLLDAAGPLGREGSGLPSEPGGPTTLDHLCLQVDPWDAGAIVAHLESRGVEPGPVGRRYGAQGHGPSLYLRDPEGNTVELKGPPTA